MRRKSRAQAQDLHSCRLHPDTTPEAFFYPKPHPFDFSTSGKARPAVKIHGNASGKPHQQPVHRFLMMEIDPSRPDWGWAPPY
ncbi:hypothetical protein BDW66DRAFT_137229 [Aspergillus desertorum]